MPSHPPCKGAGRGSRLPRQRPKSAPLKLCPVAHQVCRREAARAEFQRSRADRSKNGRAEEGPVIATETICYAPAMHPREGGTVGRTQDLPRRVRQSWDSQRIWLQQYTIQYLTPDCLIVPLYRWAQFSSTIKNECPHEFLNTPRQSLGPQWPCASAPRNREKTQSTPLHLIH